MPTPLKTVDPDILRAARAASCLTQAAAASLVYNAVQNWQNWEQGRYPMPFGIYELFLLKTGQLSLRSLTHHMRSVQQ